MDAQNPWSFDGTRYCNVSFSDAKIVMTIETLFQQCHPIVVSSPHFTEWAQEINKMVGDFWFERLSQWTDAFMSVRSSSEEHRFIDVIYLVIK